MKKSEKNALVRLVHHMQKLQTKIEKPTNIEATDEEVRRLFSLFWEWTDTPRYPVPSKTMIENLVALMRGLPPREYCYISGSSVARIIKECVNQNCINQDKDIAWPLFVETTKGDDCLSDGGFYASGKWNYKPSPLVETLYQMHINPQLFADAEY